MIQGYLKDGWICFTALEFDVMSTKSLKLYVGPDLIESEAALQRPILSHLLDHICHHWIYSVHALKMKRMRLSVTLFFPPASQYSLHTRSILIGIGKLHENIDVFNTILVNGVRIENPEGKSAKALLRDYIVAALRCTPRYEFSKNDDLMNPVTCAIYVHEKRYSMESRPSKVLAREAAVESALTKLIPDYQKLLEKKCAPACDKSVEYNDPMMSHGMDSKAMNLEDFKQLSMSDDRVLPACLALSIRTPAQVLQEYQNRNRGISVVYNTVMTEKNGCNSFKTVASCGRKAGEGVGSTKRISKQLAAQALLARLHERSPYKCYYDIADLYSSLAKTPPQATTNVNEIEEAADPNEMEYRGRKRSRDYVDDVNGVVHQTRISRRHVVTQEMSDEEELYEKNSDTSHADHSAHNGRRVWIKHSSRPCHPNSHHNEC
nr:double stranded RNA binding putative [Albugo laibachii Nc14]|eukprot:CCA21638.1 double stranded RNA binding putative [Albugo laibachii Nc14]